MNDWWRSAVIYQIYPRSFMDGNGDGAGDLPGIAGRLDHVQGLGADAIWISPFFKSPMKDFGYDVSDYRQVDPLFGTLEDFDRLLAEAHARRLKLIIDQVLSHSSDQHPWFLESRQDRVNPKADWYVWADAKPDGSPPNNWLSVFGGVAWHWEPRRGQYYLHNFLASQPDLNCHNPEVRQAALGNLEFWLQRGVDGFRLDAVNFCMHDRQLRDNPPKQGPAGKFLNEGGQASPYAMQEHRFDHTHPDNLGFLEEIRRLLDRYQAVALGEIGAERSMQVIGEYTRDGARLHMAYSFDLMGEDASAGHIKQVMENLQRHAAAGWCCLAIGNHDVRRVASRWTGDRPSPESAKLFAMLLCCLRGAVCLYQGDELGLPEAEVPYECLQDPYGRNFWPVYKGRDGCRTPMPWRKDAANAGFSEAKPWLPVDARHFPLAADQQVGQPGSVYECLRSFLDFRKRQPALLHGDMSFLPVQDELLAFTRAEPRQKLLLCFNLTDAARRMARPQLPGDGELAPLESYPGRRGALADGELRLPPRSAFIAEVR